ITVEEAKKILIANSYKLEKSEKRKVSGSSGYFLAENIFSKLDLPPFNQSNVDGYAVKLSLMNEWKVIDEIKAGDSKNIILKKDQAVRIFTGAVVPEVADCVLMQERVTIDKDKISTDGALTRGEFIRLKGSQIKKGDLAVPKDVLITPALTGFLSAIGFKKIKVYRKPRIFVIVTGNELEIPGNKLSHGKVYDSNSYILRSALEQIGLKAAKIIFVKDNKKKLLKAISECIRKADMLLISGGVSVGKYDFVNDTLEELGTEKLFYKILQRPGKPLYFGKNKKTIIFGLPGNPASVLTCFYEYVYPLLRKMQGYENLFLQERRLKLLRDVNKTFKLSNFLKAKASIDSVESLEGQASFMLRAFTEANCFIYLPLETSHVSAGEEVEVHMLP
ncbi:MAG: gephyrin-like molybdotransferase Glp, partial [Ignavibacteria bacterium]